MLHVLSMALDNWSCSLLSWRSQDLLRLLNLQGACSTKHRIKQKQKPIIVSKNMYLAETKGMRVACDSNWTLKILWHRHCNMAMMYFVKHRKTQIVVEIFEGVPTKVTQHCRNTIMVGISIWDPPCGPPLHHFYLLYALLAVRVPHAV